MDNALGENRMYCKNATYTIFEKYFQPSYHPAHEATVMHDLYKSSPATAALAAWFNQSAKPTQASGPRG
jgi:hypothetical protein